MFRCRFSRHDWVWHSRNCWTVPLITSLVISLIISHSFIKRHNLIIHADLLRRRISPHKSRCRERTRHQKGVERIAEKQFMYCHFHTTRKHFTDKRRHRRESVINCLINKPLINAKWFQESNEEFKCDNSWKCNYDALRWVLHVKANEALRDEYARWVRRVFFFGTDDENKMKVFFCATGGLGCEM